jgi:hypothetical protein
VRWVFRDDLLGNNEKLVAPCEGVLRKYELATRFEADRFRYERPTRKYLRSFDHDLSG